MNSIRDSTRKITIVVPCYNEALRWNRSYWEMVSKIPSISLFFVDDGSSDNTLELIEEFSITHNCGFISLDSNSGKAEAIRQGFLRVPSTFQSGLGFLDADAAFSVEEVERQVRAFLDRNPSIDSGIALWSSRVQLAGRSINRLLLRHYLARILVTVLALRLKFSIYDPQSGLKIYPNDSVLISCFEKPFQTRWFVDLEIFLRYKEISGVDMKVWEEPVVSWEDVAGSKITSFEYIRIIKDIFRILR